MNEHTQKGEELEELAELLRTVVERKQRTGQAEFTVEEKARHDALLAREDVREQLRDRQDLMDLIFQIADWGRVPVATIHREDGSKEKLLSALREANITPDHITESHGIAVIYVRNQDQARALSIIEADAKEHCYWAWLCHEVNPELRDTLR